MYMSSRVLMCLQGVYMSASLRMYVSVYMCTYVYIHRERPFLKCIHTWSGGGGKGGERHTHREREAFAYESEQQFSRASLD